MSDLTEATIRAELPPSTVEVTCPRCGLRFTVPWEVKWENGRPTSNIRVDMAPIDAHVATHFEPGA